MTIHEAKTHLSRLVQEVLAGRPVVIARGHEPVVRLVPAEPPREREFGAFKGRIAIGPEFFEPLPDEELAAWGEE